MAALILFLIIGLALLALLEFPIKETPLAGVAGLSFLYGVTVSVFVLTLVAVVTGQITFELMWALAVVSVGILGWKRKWLIERAKLINWRFKGISGKGIVFRIIVIIFCLIQINMLVDVATAAPILGIDAVGNFAHKAKMWYFTRDLIPAEFLNPEYITFKRGYPPIISMSEAIWAWCAGGWVDTDIKLFFIVFWLCSGLLIFSELKQRGAKFTHWLAMAAWLMLPYNLYESLGGAIDGFGDVPLAAFFLAAVILLLRFHDSKSTREVMAMAIMLAATCFVKKEGYILIAAALGFLAWKRSSWRAFSAVIGMTAVFTVVHKLTIGDMPTFLERDISLDHTFSEITERIAIMLSIILDDIDKERLWGDRLWYMVLGLWVFKIFRDRSKCLLRPELFFIVFMLAAYGAIFTLTVFDIKRTVGSTWDRLFIHMYPLILLVSFHGFEFAVSSKDKIFSINDLLSKPGAKRNLLFIMVFAFALYAIRNEADDYDKWERRLSRNLEKTEWIEPPQILLMLGYDYFIPYAEALNYIQQSDSQKFWVLASDMIGIFEFSYFCYPKEIYMNVETQKQVELRFNSMMQEEPIIHYPPTNDYDEIVIIDVEPRKWEDVWTGPQFR